MKFNTGFSEDSDDDLASLGEKVGQAAETVAGLAGITPSGSDIKNSAAALRSAMARTDAGRGPAIISARTDLIAKLKLYARNADEKPGMTDEVRAQTNLPIAKDTAHTAAPLHQVQNLRLEHGDNQGEVIPHCDPMKGARGYKTQWTLDPNSETWTDGPMFPSTRGMKLTGLPRGKDIWVRICAWGTAGDGPWSDPATIMVT